MSSGRYHGTPNSSTTTLAEEETCRAHDAPCSSARLGVAPEALTTRTGAQVHSVEEGHECCKEKGLDAEEEEVWTYPDGGLRAWLVVLGCWLYTQGLLGYGLTWGVLVQEVQKFHPNTSVAQLNLVVGVANFLLNSTAFGFGRLGDVWGYKRLIGIGAICTSASLIISAFVYKSLAGLFLVQGVMVGTSIGIAMPLCLSLPSQWFSARRGIATGLVASGAGIGGGIASLIMRALLPRVGYRNTLLVYAGYNSVLWLCAFPLLKTRLPPLRPGQSSRVSKSWLPRGVWSTLTWYSWIGAIFVAVFGYLSPAYFLTAYTTFETGLSPSTIEPAVPLIIFGFMSGLGRIFAGFVADLIGPLNTLWSSFFVAGLLQFVFWPFAKSYGAIIAFALLEGFSGSAFMSLIPVGAANLFGSTSGEGLGAVVGFTTLCGSPGQLLSGTFAGLIRDGGAGNQYQAVAFYGGSVMVAGSVILLYARFANQPRLFAKF